jgi:predicted ATP-dependent endonuclease of OLD family
MRLESFRVRDFRNIVDSGPIKVQGDVTCLVGKNESGKTALLEALNRVNPARPASFNVEEEYPRWKLTRDQKSGIAQDAKPIWARFELEDEDFDAIAGWAGPSVLADPHIEVLVSYANQRTMLVQPDERQAAHNLLETIAPQARGALESVGSLAELREIAASVADDESTDGGDVSQEQLTSIVQAVDALVGSRESFELAFISFLMRRLPKFFYFDEYSSLPGRSNLQDLAGDPTDPKLQTAQALLRLAGTDVTALGDPNFNLRKAALEAVSNDLTDQVFEFWKQNRDLKVEVEVDIVVGSGPNVATSSVERFLEIRVEDRRHGFTNNFGQRSSGFQWFFSFLAAFSEFEEKEGRAVILLDEPALTLHGKAQDNFLRFIDVRLAPKHQVLYTTHSPFMVEMGHLERVRIVEDKGSKEGAAVIDSALAKDPDSLFPLQAALGYDIAQSLFIGPDNLVIEGTSDFAYLQVMSDHLKVLGREGLDPRWRLLPAGSASNIPTFVALMGPHLDVTVLVDSGTQGMQRLQNMTVRGLLKDQRFITVGDILGSNQADIEDLFTPEDYIALYNLAFKTRHSVNELPETDRIVKRLAIKEGGDFDHGVPADYLLRNREQFLATLATLTVDNFEKLFRRVNQTLA